MLNILALTITQCTTTMILKSGNTTEKTYMNEGLGMLSRPDRNLKPI